MSGQTAERRARRRCRALAESTLALLCCGLLAGAGCGGASPTTTSVASEDVHLDGEASTERHPASALVARGERHLIAEEAIEARAVFEAALHENPKDPRALLDLGLALELLGDARRAEGFYREALAVDPAFPQALNNLGLLLRARGDFPESVASFERALKEDCGFAEAQVNLALTLEEAGELPRAEQAYARAVELLPRDAMVRANYGQLLLELGASAEAEVELRRALSIAGEETALLLTIGNGLRRVGANEPAMVAMRRAVAARAGGPTPALLAELSLAERAAGDRESAEASLMKALELDAQYPLAHYLVAGLKASRGAFRDAIRHYESYLKLEPRGPHAEKARRHMAAARRAAR